jgi:two-component system sensor histidine kinase KdpD
VLIALSGGPEGDTLIRRGERIAARAAGGELLAVHVTPADGLAAAPPERLARQRALVESLGGTYHTVTGDDSAQGVLDFARQHNITQIVIGATSRSRLKELLGKGTGTTIVEGSGDDIDVYIVTHEHAAHGRLFHLRKRNAKGSSESSEAP